MGAKGIDSWLSVWSNGLLLENVDENHQRVTRFFPIDSLHYCAAVRYVLVPSTSPSGGVAAAAGSERMARFLPLDSPFARHPNIHHPPLFACIMRRTTGIKVLECHVFICKRETAANALVRCCFHAYADSTYAHHLEEEEQQGAKKGRSRPTNGTVVVSDTDTTLNSIEKVETWKLYQQQQQQQQQLQQQQNGQPKIQDETAREGSTSSHGMGSASVSMLILDHGSADEDNASSIVNGDQNHKIWLPSTSSSTGVPRRLAASGPVAPVADMYGGGNTNTMRSVRSSASSMMPNTLQTRSSRPRQILAPFAAPPPPPPIVQPTALDEPDSKLKKLKKKRLGGTRASSDIDDMSSVATGPVNGGRRASNSVFNFPIHRGGGIGGPGVPPPGYPMSYPFFPGQRQPPPGAYLVPMPIPLPSNGKKSKGLKFGTFSARGGKKIKPSKNHPAGMMFLPPPPPPVMAPPPMALGLPVPMMAPPLSMRRGSMATSAEEPIYMPSQVRPLSPIASYAPAHFPHEAYLMQQHYTTLIQQPGGKGSHQTTLTKLKKKDKMKKNKMAMQQQPQPLLVEPQMMMDGLSLHGGEEVSLTSQSAGGGGIYRKGHLNERAFSYSIRQEHRSRSYSSLAGLGGASAFPSGPEDLRAHDKKERELIQMVHDLDLSGDDLERSEVPLAMYPHHHRQQPR